MDRFYEESISRIGNGMNMFLYHLFNILMYVFGIVSLFMLSGLMSAIGSGRADYFITFVFFFFVILTIFSYVLRNNQNIEYDYTFTNGVFDVAKIINGSRRVRILSTDVSKFLEMGYQSSDGFGRALNDPSIKKRYNCFLNKNKELFYCILPNKDGVKSLLVIEPSEELVKLFRETNPIVFKKS